MRSLLLLLAFLTVASIGLRALEAAENARIEYEERGGLSAREYHDAQEWERLQRDFYSAWEVRP